MLFKTSELRTSAKLFEGIHTNVTIKISLEDKFYFIELEGEDGSLKQRVYKKDKGYPNPGETEQQAVDRSQSDQLKFLYSLASLTNADELEGKQVMSWEEGVKVLQDVINKSGVTYNVRLVTNDKGYTEIPYPNGNCNSSIELFVEGQEPKIKMPKPAAPKAAAKNNDDFPF